MSKSKALLARGMSPSRAAAAFGAKSLIVASAAAMPLVLWSAGAMALEPIELLGKNLFFDTSLSTPGNKQGCVSCHEPKMGWVFPDKAVNAKTVVAPGAAPHRLGDIKPPANAYASLSPEFEGFVVPPPPPPIPPIPPQALPGFGGGNFWNGRALGCGANSLQGTCKGVIAGDIDKKAVSETITEAALLPPNDKITKGKYADFLGATADQALNPFPKGVEQNAGEKKVCQQVKTAKYKQQYFDAWGEEIDCGTGLHKSFQRIAIALAAWQKSTDVVPFDSKRDDVLRGKVQFSDAEKQGRDLFYGDGACSFCHSGLPNKLSTGLAPDDPNGAQVENLYTDHKYHNIGTPFNREIPGVGKGKKKGLSEVVSNPAKVADGFFKTPTVRNVAKGVDTNGKGKAFAHNGYFKTLKGIVHFYNTRDTLDKCEELPKPIVNATEKEALDNNCWPKAEFTGFVTPIVGNLGLSESQENDIVAYLNALSDQHTPAKP